MLNLLLHIAYDIIKFAIKVCCDLWVNINTLCSLRKCIAVTDLPEQYCKICCKVTEFTLYSVCKSFSSLLLE